MMKKENKILLKYFVLVFLASALIINWNEISWIFNYRVIFGTVSDFFESKAETQINKTIENKEIEKPLKDFEISNRENSIEIPKIEVSVPLIFKKNATEKDLYKLLDSGVVFFPDSVLPGEPGKTIILGHSAPPGWPKIKYDWVFTRISELTEGDVIFVYFGHKKYTYYVQEKIFLERGEEIADNLTNSDNMLFLISCWPPGKDLKRIAVVAK